MMRLYQFEECPYCHMVRQKLSDLAQEGHDIRVELVYVIKDRAKRKEVIAVSGQPSVPVLVDGDVVLDDEEKILPYLEKKFNK